jgi:ABC-type glycerol-3-phosphate transport system permease component
MKRINFPSLPVRIASHAFLVALAAVIAFPFYWLLISSLKPGNRIFSFPPQFIPHPWQLDNFIQAFVETNVLRAFLNSTITTAGHCGLALFLCSLGGYAFAKFPNAPGRDKLFAFLLATMAIPGAVTIVPLFVILCQLHAVNTYWAMIVPGAAGSFGIFWMRQYIVANVSDELLDAARIDGCSEFGIYWRVVLPIIRPGLAALGILLLIGSWNNLMWAYIVMRTEDMYTLPLLIYLMSGQLRTPFGLVMALCVVATVPLVVAFILLQRHFIAGMTAGALKT